MQATWQSGTAPQPNVLCHCEEHSDEAIHEAGQAIEEDLICVDHDQRNQHCPLHRRNATPKDG